MINVHKAEYRPRLFGEPDTDEVIVEVRYGPGTNTDTVRAAAEKAAAPLLTAENARDIDKIIYVENADITRTWDQPTVLAAVYIYKIRTRTSREYRAA